MKALLLFVLLALVVACDDAPETDINVDAATHCWDGTVRETPADCPPRTTDDITKEEGAKPV